MTGKFKIINTDPELNLDGDLKKALLLGAKILWHRCDGWDWHIVVEMPKDVTLEENITSKVYTEDDDVKYWRFLYFATSREFGFGFSLHVSYNRTKHQVLKERNKELYEDRWQRNKVAERDPKHFYAKDKEERIKNAK